MYDKKFDELKKAIMGRKRLEGVYVFVCKADKFVPSQYLRAIVDVEGRTEEHYDSIQSLCEAVSDDAFGYLADVNVVSCEKASMTEGQFETLSKSKSLCLIMCDSFDCDAQGIEDRTFAFEKLEKWMLCDYVRSLCKGLSEEEANGLCDACECDPYLTSNEARKISCFEAAMQSDAFGNMMAEGQIGRKTETTPFKLINSIVRNDRGSTLSNLVEFEDGMKRGDSFGFVTLLKNNFRDVASVQMDFSATAQKLGISDKKFAALKWSKNRYSNEALVGILRDLTEFDWLVKSGRLDMPEERIIDYVVCTTMSR